MTDSSLIGSVSLSNQLITSNNNSESNRNRQGVLSNSQDTQQRERERNIDTTVEFGTTNKEIDRDKKNENVTMNDKNDKMLNNEHLMEEIQSEATHGGNGNGKVEYPEEEIKQRIEGIRTPEGVWRVVNLPHTVFNTLREITDNNARALLSSMYVASLDAVYFIRPNLPSITLLYSHTLPPRRQSSFFVSSSSSQASLCLHAVTLPLTWPKTLPPSLPQIVLTSDTFVHFHFSS
jgi:hypothetical protein